jgi:hypothetical protein
MQLLIAAKQKVVDGSLSAKSFHNLEMAAGFNANVHGILADRTLCEATRILDAITWDWVHNSFQDGVFTREVPQLD